jgi:hypothetical protein
MMNDCAFLRLGHGLQALLLLSLDMFIFSLTFASLSLS